MKSKTQYLPFKVCNIMIVIHTANLYNLGKNFITVSCKSKTATATKSDKVDNEDKSH